MGPVYQGQNRGESLYSPAPSNSFDFDNFPCFSFSWFHDPVAKARGKETGKARGERVSESKYVPSY